MMSYVTIYGLQFQEPSPPFVYVEFGAGRAGLSSFVAARLISLKNLSNIFLAIDRDTRRFKRDKEYNQHMKCYREKLDIADFDLEIFIRENIKEDHRLVAIAKHLCGGATDLALTSMSLQDKSLLKGVSIATCCHHGCDARTYVNMPYLEQELQLTPTDIQALPRISSWAICNDIETERRRVGFKVKRLLDYGRCLFIESKLGMEVTPYQYCDPLMESPECVLLLAVKKQS